jgi:hypothetical protein
LLPFFGYNLYCCPGVGEELGRSFGGAEGFPNEVGLVRESYILLLLLIAFSSPVDLVQVAEHADGAEFHRRPRPGIVQDGADHPASATPPRTIHSFAATVGTGNQCLN